MVGWITRVAWVGWLLCLGCGAEPSSAGESAQIPFFTFPAQRDAPEADEAQGGVLADIERHLPLSEPLFPLVGGAVLGPSIRGHEESHGIAGHFMKEGGNQARGGRVYGFYLLEDRAVVFAEPGIRKSDVCAFVPGALRGDRYEGYLVEQAAFEERPLYLIDEWVAYLNQAAITLERHGRGLIAEQPGIVYGVVDGAVEFAGYGLALLAAIEALDPGYLESEPGFRGFLSCLLERTLSLFAQGDRVPMFQLASQRELHTALLGEPGAALRRALSPARVL